MPAQSLLRSYPETVCSCLGKVLRRNPHAIRSKLWAVLINQSLLLVAVSMRWRHVDACEGILGYQMHHLSGARCFTFDRVSRHVKLLLDNIRISR